MFSTDLFSTWKSDDIRDYIGLLEVYAKELGDELSTQFNNFFFFPKFREGSAGKTRQSWINLLAQCIGKCAASGYAEDHFAGIQTSMTKFFDQAEGNEKVDPSEFERCVEHLTSEHGITIVEQLMQYLKTFCINEEEPEEDSAEKSEVGIKLASILDTFFGAHANESAIQFNCLVEDEIENGNHSDEVSAILARLKFPGVIRLLASKSLSRRELLSHLLSSASNAELNLVIELIGRILLPLSAENSVAEVAQVNTEAEMSKLGNEAHPEEKVDRAPIEEAALESLSSLCQFQSASITSVCKTAVETLNDAFDQIYSSKSHKGRIALIEMISSPSGDNDEPQKLLRCVACDVAQESSLYGSALSEHGMDYGIIECSPEELLESQEDLVSFVATQLKDYKNAVIGVIGFDVSIQGHSTVDDIKFIEVHVLSNPYSEQDPLLSEQSASLSVCRERLSSLERRPNG
jgi:hypothetical protein